MGREKWKREMGKRDGGKQMERYMENKIGVKRDG
jgi:hypothetical protein